MTLHTCSRENEIEILCFVSLSYDDPLGFKPESKQSFIELISVEVGKEVSNASQVEVKFWGRSENSECPQLGAELMTLRLLVRMLIWRIRSSNRTTLFLRSLSFPGKTSLVIARSLFRFPVGFSPEFLRNNIETPSPY